MVDKKLIYNNEIAESTAHALQGGVHGFKAIPGLIKKIIREECWRERYDSKRRKEFKSESFESFVTGKPPKGLGSDIETLRRLCADDDEVLIMLRAATTQTRGGDKKSEKAKEESIKNNNIIFDKPIQGTSKSYSLTRLEKDRPDLYEQVREKRLSTNAAMIEAGFKEKTITVPIDVKKAAAVLARNFKEDTAKLIEAIQELL